MVSRIQPSSGGVRTAIITGAARRVGRAIALSLARSSWQIAVHYRTSPEAAATLVEEIDRLGGKAVALDAELTDIDQLRALAPRCAEMLGAPSCLINNASQFLKDELGTLDPAGWQAHIDTNLRAPVFLAQSFAGVLPAGQCGHIINIIDQRVLKPSPEFFSYSVSKAGLWWATQTMAQALAPKIRVNAIAPGPVLQSIHQTARQFEAEQRDTLLGHGASPDDVAAAVHFLLETPSITGQMICVDSGQHLS
jgi:NAD(P)-dependent dehydrogenase (short-subunit alcohol dehydrogenase family)